MKSELEEFKEMQKMSQNLTESIGSVPTIGSIKQNPSLPEHLKARLKMFIDLGLKASFHYCDETGREHAIGLSDQHKCEQMFREATPVERALMIDASRQFIWTLDVARILR